MKQKTLTEETEDLYFKLLHIIAKIEQVKLYQINIIDITPVLKGLKVIYSVATDRVIQWSRVINYSTLANEI